MENLNLPDFSKYAKGFSESKFWDKLAAFAKSAGLKVVAAALLLYYVLKSEDTPRADKAKIVGALGYFILPVDIIPDFIPVAGFTDDLLVAFREPAYWNAAIGISAVSWILLIILIKKTRGKLLPSMPSFL